MNEAARSSAPASGSFVDPRTLMRIRHLELRARLVVEGFRSGLHRSPSHGFSVEFTEYRHYAPGDDLRYLDWQVYARSDRYYVRKFEDETNLRCHLLVDCSRSMDYGTTGYTKADYAATLAGTLAYFLQGQGDAVGLLRFDERVREFLPARLRTGHLRQLLIALEKPADGRSTDLFAPLARITELVRKRGLVVYVSDFLAPVANLENSLRALGACGHEVAVFQVLDPAELTLELPGPALFEDAESEEVRFVDPTAARADYLRRFGAHCDAVRATCQKLGVACHRVATDRPLEFGLFEFLQERLRHGRHGRRAGRDRARGAA